MACGLTSFLGPDEDFQPVKANPSQSDNNRACSVLLFTQGQNSQQILNLLGKLA